MEHKILKKCSQCDEAKELNLFPKRGAICKVCKAKSDKLYHEQNKERIHQRKKE